MQRMYNPGPVESQLCLRLLLLDNLLFGDLRGLGLVEPGYIIASPTDCMYTSLVCNVDHVFVESTKE